MKPWENKCLGIYVCFILLCFLCFFVVWNTSLLYVTVISLVVWCVDYNFVLFYIAFFGCLMFGIQFCFILQCFLCFFDSWRLFSSSPLSSGPSPFGRVFMCEMHVCFILLCFLCFLCLKCMFALFYCAFFGCLMFVIQVCFILLCFLWFFDSWRLFSSSLLSSGPSPFGRVFRSQQTKESTVK